MTPNRTRRQTHADPPRLLRLDRPAADARGSAGVSRKTTRPTRSRRSSTGCSPRRTTANAGAGIGSMSRATPTPRASSIAGAKAPVYPYAWTYRDYVIKAFNDDKPYDRFILEQLAADKLNPGTNRERAGRARFPHAGRSFQRQHERHHQRSHRCHHQGISRPDRFLRPLPRPQVRSHPAGGLLLVARHFRELRGTVLKPEICDPNGNPNYEEYLASAPKWTQRIQNARTQNMATVFGDYKRLAGVYLYATQMPDEGRDAYCQEERRRSGSAQELAAGHAGGGRQATSIFGLWNALARIPPARFARRRRADSQIWHRTIARAS